MSLLDMQGMTPSAPDGGAGRTCQNYSYLSLVMCTPPACSHLSILICD